MSSVYFDLSVTLSFVLVNLARSLAIDGRYFLIDESGLEGSLTPARGSRLAIITRRRLHIFIATQDLLARGQHGPLQPVSGPCKLFLFENPIYLAIGKLYN